jgi:tRNA pseudouridine38-40 synthase
VVAAAERFEVGQPAEGAGQSAEGGDRTPTGRSAEGGDRTPTGQSAEGGDRTPTGQSGGEERARTGILLTVAYDGRPFAGFARQPNQRTVAGELDGAVRAIDPHASLVRGASRTDAGVHAHGQVVAFDTERTIPPRGWAHALSHHLPDEISVVAAANVPVNFEPRHHALNKTYRYVFLQSSVRDPFLEGRAWRVAERLNHEAMDAMARTLLGTHDFRAFRSSNDERTDTVRTIVRARVRTARSDARAVELEVTGDRFLHRMMRIISGTLRDVALGRRSAQAFCQAFVTGARGDLGPTAPPHGLYLVRIELDQARHSAWPEEPESAGPDD